MHDASVDTVALVADQLPLLQLLDEVADGGCNAVANARSVTLIPGCCPISRIVQIWAFVAGARFCTLSDLDFAKRKA
jgi:hypothetical protein